jgi:hypothetical protein
MFSAFPLEADIVLPTRHVRKVPQTEVVSLFSQGAKEAWHFSGGPSQTISFAFAFAFASTIWARSKDRTDVLGADQFVSI